LIAILSFALFFSQCVFAGTLFRSSFDDEGSSPAVGAIVGTSSEKSAGNSAVDSKLAKADGSIALIAPSYAPFWV